MSVSPFYWARARGARGFDSLVEVPGIGVVGRQSGHWKSAPVSCPSAAAPGDREARMMGCGGPAAVAIHRLSWCLLGFAWPAVADMPATAVAQDSAATLVGLLVYSPKCPFGG